MTDTRHPPACGHPVDRVLELVAAEADGGPDPALAAEIAGCPDCTAELDELRGRWNQVRLAAAEPVPVPAGLVTRALAAVRTVRGGPGGGYAELAEPGGLVRIPEPTLLMLVRRLARDVAETHHGVRFRGLGGGVDGLAVRVAVRYGAVLADVADRLRRDLEYQLDVVLGPAAPVVDVVIEDILAPEQDG